jgi:hypothetical protein
MGPKGDAMDDATAELVCFVGAAPEGVERRMHALLELEGGCFMGDVCKEQLANKTKPLPGHPACTGFSWQQVSNGSHCLKAYRTGNREVRVRWEA